MLVAGEVEEETDGKRAERTGAWPYEGTTRRISSISAAALGAVLRAQAPKRGFRCVYASRRRLRGSLPVVREDRTRKGQRRRCAACAVGSRWYVTSNKPHQGVGCLSSHS